MAERKIIHIDMDAFYAAVEMRDDPRLQGRAVAVGGHPGERGVIATANYVARKYGVRSAMPSWKAKELCPDLLILFPNFDKYKTESRAIHAIFKEYSDLIEPLSLDEAYIDVSAPSILKGSATAIAQEIRHRIKKERGLTASAGVAPNKFLAKVASEWNKPDGLFVLPPRLVQAFMEELPVEKIYGVGKVLAKKMRALNLYTCKDLQEMDLLSLQKEFGSRAWELYELSRGIDHRPVSIENSRKSLSVETTFSHDLKEREESVQEINHLYADLFRRFEKIKDEYVIKKPFVKIKFTDFSTTTVESAQHLDCSLQTFYSLLAIGWKRKALPVRLIGLGVSLNKKKERQLSFLEP